jgi:hypothetical protein
MKKDKTLFGMYCHQWHLNISEVAALTIGFDLKVLIGSGSAAILFSRTLTNFLLVPLCFISSMKLRFASG